MDLQTDWNALLARSEIDSIFLSHGWHKCFWNAWGVGRQLRILVARKAGQPVGIAPLWLYPGQPLRSPVNILSFIENDESPHCGFIVEKSCVQHVVPAFLDYICAHQITWDILMLRKMPLGNTQINYIKTYCQQNATRWIARPSLRSPVLSTASSWESFYYSRSRRFKKRIRYIKNKYSKLGEIRVSESHAPAEIKSLMAQIYAVGARSWKGKTGTAIGSTEQQRRFFSELPFALAPEGKVGLWFLRFDSQIIAFEYHVRHKNTVYALRGSFDEAYRTCSPGSILDAEIIRRLFSSDVRRYNMCGDPYAHKLRWTSDILPHEDIKLYGRRFSARVLYFLEKDIKPIVKSIRKSIRHARPRGIATA